MFHGGFLCFMMVSYVPRWFLMFHGGQPSPQRIRPEHAQTLEKYNWQSSQDSFTGIPIYLCCDNHC